MRPTLEEDHEVRQTKKIYIPWVDETFPHPWRGNLDCIGKIKEPFSLFAARLHLPHQKGGGETGRDWDLHGISFKGPVRKI